MIAPVAGRASVNLLTKGNLVVADQTLLTTIVSQDPMYVYFDVDTSTMLRVKKLIREGKVKSYEEADYPVEIGLPSETGYPHRGRIDYVSNQVTPGTGTLNVRGNFPNADRVLTPGLYVHVRIPVGPPHKAMLVADRRARQRPGTALPPDRRRQESGRSSGRSHRRGFTTAVSAKSLRGCGDSEWVIVDGLLRVRPGATAGAEKAADADAADRRRERYGRRPRRDQRTEAVSRQDFSREQRARTLKGVERARRGSSSIGRSSPG